MSTTTGEVIAALLDAVNWTDPDGRLLDVGDTITGQNADGTKTALSLVEELLEAERGVFYISGAGVATYESRDAIAQRRTSEGTITNGALRSDPGFEVDRLINRQTVQRTVPGGTDGTPQTAKNETSIQTYGLSDGGSLSTPYLSSDEAALRLATYLARLKGQPEQPIQVELNGPDAYPWLGLELQDRVSVDDTIGGTVLDGHVQGIEHEISMSGLNHTLTLTLSKRGPEAFIIGESEIGSTTDLLGY